MSWGFRISDVSGKGQPLIHAVGVADRSSFDPNLSPSLQTSSPSWLAQLTGVLVNSKHVAEFAGNHGDVSKAKELQLTLDMDAGTLEIKVNGVRGQKPIGTGLKGKELHP